MPSHFADFQAAGTRDHANEQIDWRIEAFRALAAVMVMTVHYLPWFGGTNTPLLYLFTGVDLFFVLSGYVFAPYLLSGRRLELLPFFVRRWFRLFPLYLLSLLAFAAIKWGDPALGPMVLRHVLMAHTLESRDIAFYFNGAYWSLPPEVEFYLMLPAFALLCRHRWGLVSLIAIAVCARLLVTLNLPEHHFDVTAAAVATYHLPGLLVEFLCGVGAWWLANQMPGRSRSAGTALLVAGLLLSLVWANVVVGHLHTGSDARLHADPLTRGNVGMVAAIGYGLIVAGALRILPTIDVPAVAKSVALWAGGCSYAVYLMHGVAPPLLARIAPGLTGAALGIAATVLTILIASLLNRMFENPMRLLGRRLAAHRSLGAHARKPITS